MEPPSCILTDTSKADPRSDDPLSYPFLNINKSLAGQFRGARSCFEMVTDVYYSVFSRQFRLRKRERGIGHVTDDEDENGRKDRLRNESDYFKIAS